MSGKILGIFFIATALIAGVAMYWLQIYAFYEELEPENVEIRLTSLATGQPEPVGATVTRAIDADSSPLRFRACLDVPLSQAALSETYVAADNAVPLTAPGWFDCFDAAAIGASLERGTALAFLAQRDIADGIDRVVAVYADGRAFAWHQLNEKFED